MLYGSNPLDIPAFTGAATYSQTGTAVTVTLAAHGYQVGSWFRITPSTGTGLPGVFQAASAPTTGTFTYTATTSLTTSGNATVEGVISIDDPYSLAMIDYVGYRAYSKDNDLIGNDARAKGHYAAFESTMIGKAQADGVVAQTKDNVAG
jgi:hypothetical protein